MSIRLMSISMANRWEEIDRERRRRRRRRRRTRRTIDPKIDVEYTARFVFEPRTYQEITFDQKIEVFFSEQKLRLKRM